MNDILEKLVDLHKQATVERSHHYTAQVITEAMTEIAQLRLERRMRVDNLDKLHKEITLYRTFAPPSVSYIVQRKMEEK